jgi:hypothetical protein
MLNIYKPKSILELGTGNGDWLLFVAYALQDGDAKLLGFENFSWKFNNSWEASLQDLRRLVKSKLEDAHLPPQIVLKEVDITTMDASVEYQGQVFDMVRLDCLAIDECEIRMVIDAVMPYTSKNCIFLVDDINVNNCPNRYFAMMHLVEQGKLKPLWFGSKEGAWVYPDFNFEKFQSCMTDKLDGYWYTAKFFNYPILGQHRDWLSVWPHHL